jgi:hypothetical protein
VLLGNRLRNGLAHNLKGDLCFGVVKSRQLGEELLRKSVLSIRSENEKGHAETSYAARFGLITARTSASKN